MSKHLKSFSLKLKAFKGAAAKFNPACVQGHRIGPNRTKDAEHQFRIDAGHYNPLTKLLNVILQVNSQTTSEALIKYLKKNKAHGKLATEQFDTAAADQDAELVRVVESMEEQAKEKLG